jgi:hypothetical protein
MTLSVSGDSITFPDLSTQLTAPSGFGFKNRIINGDMRIDQRNAGASVMPADGQYTLDRWKGFRNGGGAYTVQRSSVVPSGVLSNSAALTVTTPDTSIVSTDYYAFNQDVEGFNAADFAWGTSAAMPVSLSFWLRTSVTGTWVVALLNADGSRAYPATFTVTVADTWQQVTLTIPGITSGVWGTTNGSGVTLRFDLGSGSSINGTANVWNTAGGFVGTRTLGSVNWIGTAGATFFLTGAQLEKGSTATAFDYRDYGRELSMCQRYYERTYPIQYPFISATYINGTNESYHHWYFKVEKRATPTWAFVGSWSVAPNAVPWTSVTEVLFGSTSYFYGSSSSYGTATAEL